MSFVVSVLAPALTLIGVKIVILFIYSVSRVFDAISAGDITVIMQISVAWATTGIVR